MTMGEGGAVYTDNPLLHRIIRSLRDWGRDCICPSGHDNFCGHRFDRQYGELPLGYDHKYVYSHFGYNLKATDMQAAVGCAQLEKFPEFVKKRRKNFERLLMGLQDVQDKLILPVAQSDSNPSWFGFMMTCKEGTEREKVVPYIEKHGVQTRMLFAGNLIKHPCFDELRNRKEGYRIVGTLKNTDRIMKDTFWVGVYPGMTEEMIARVMAGRADQNEEDRFSTGIAVRNVIDRLQLYYKEENLFTIESDGPGKGTRVHIILPVYKDELE